MPTSHRWTPRRWKAGHYRNPLFDAELRAARTDWRLGDEALCEGCGETRRAVLHVRNDDSVLCYECIADEQGRPTVELDHPLGRKVAPGLTEAIPANDNQLYNDPDIGPEERFARSLDQSTAVLVRRLRRSA